MKIEPSELTLELSEFTLHYSSPDTFHEERVKEKELSEFKRTV